MQQSKNIERTPITREQYHSYELGEEEGFLRSYLKGEELGDFINGQFYPLKRGVLTKKKKNSTGWWKKTERKKLVTRPKNGKINKRNANSQRRGQELLFLQRVKEIAEVVLDSVTIALIEDVVVEGEY